MRMHDAFSLWNAHYPSRVRYTGRQPLFIAPPIASAVCSSVRRHLRFFTPIFRYPIPILSSPPAPHFPSRYTAVLKAFRLSKGRPQFLPATATAFPLQVPTSAGTIARFMGRTLSVAGAPAPPAVALNKRSVIQCGPSDFPAAASHIIQLLHHCSAPPVCNTEFCDKRVNRLVTVRIALHSF